MVNIEVGLKLNGKNITIKAPVWKSLLDILREDLGLTGTKGSCVSGNCGYCLVFINGKIANACLIPLFQLQDMEIITIEGINQIKEFPEVNLIISEVLNFNINYRSNGIIMAVKSLFLEKTFPTETDIRYVLSSILSPIDDYDNIFQGIKRIADLRGRRRRVYT